MSYSYRVRILRVMKTYTEIRRTYSVPKVKQLGSDNALKHFDQFYRSVFDNWPSMRLALLCPHYYCAVANVFAKGRSASQLFGDLQVFNMKDAYYLNLSRPEKCEEPFDSEVEHETHANNTAEQGSCTNDVEEPISDTEEETDAIEEFMPATTYKQLEFFSEEFDDFYTPNPNFNAQLIRHGVIHFPEHWEVYMFPRGKFKKFPPPKVDVTGLLNYYLMDAASILPILALDIKKGEDVGDLCASPGGKSLAILFSLRFERLVCNDLRLSRVNRLKTVLNSYLPNTEDWSKKILVSNLDVCDWRCFDAFDKILLDVPCTNDRLSATKDANNIFSQKRLNERLQLPQIQTTMLCAALKGLKPGGSLVYSTCSLSPLQNDGVVHMALSKLSSEISNTFAVADLDTAFNPLRNMFHFSETCRYGQLVVPFLPLNYGPMYISKITRTS